MLQSTASNCDQYDEEKERPTDLDDHAELKEKQEFEFVDEMRWDYKRFTNFE